MRWRREFGHGGSGWKRRRHPAHIPEHPSLQAHSPAFLLKHLWLHPWLFSPIRGVHVRLTESASKSASRWWRMGGCWVSTCFLIPQSSLHSLLEPQESQLSTVVTCSRRHPALAFSPPSLSSSLLLVLPGIAFQIHHFHPNPGLKVSSRRTQLRQVLN